MKTTTKTKRPTARNRGLCREPGIGLSFAMAALLGLGVAEAQAQTTLSVGDISFLAAEADSNGAVADGMTVVPWANLAPGTVIKFTDNGMANNAGTSINNTEHVWTFTVGASTINVGTVLRFTYSSPTAGKWNGPASGTVSVDLAGTGAAVNPGLSTSGDQLFVYQGTGTGANIGSGNPGAFTGTLIAGINIGTIITSGNPNSNSTYTPTTLTSGNAWVDGGNVDNGYYSGARTGLTNTLYRAATTNGTNFTFSNTVNGTYDNSTNFSIATSASIHWDANGSTAGNGGNGTWDTTTSDRFKNGASGTTYFRWVNSSSGNDHTAVFGGTAGTVSVASGGVTASGLQFDTTSYTIQNNTITLAGSAPTINVTTGSSTISSALAGSAGITKTGTGSATVSGANTYSGDTTISAGTLKLGAANVIPDGAGKGNVSVTGTLDLNTFSETINGLSGSGTVDNTAAGTPTLTVGGNDATSAFGGVIKNTAGTLALSKTGTGTLTLSGANTFAGGTSLSAGTLALTSTGALSNGGSTVVVTVTGNSTTLTNAGTISQTGTGRAIDVGTANLSITMTNSGSINTVSTDAIRVNADSAVSLTNSGTIAVSAGGQAIDFAAITTKSNSLTNQSTGIISAVGEDAVRPGTNGVVNNAGTISATPTGGASPSGSDGIDVRTFTGIQITNTGSITGRHGIATDSTNTSSAITVNNNTGGTITALNGSGLNIDGVSVNVTANVTNQAGATIKGGVLAVATDGDGDGIDVDGVLTLNNSGDVLGLGAKGTAGSAEGIAAGGGSITNTATGQIIGSTLAADAPNGDSGKAGNGILIDDSNGGNAIAATTVTNSGLIQGKSGFGIQIIGTFADTITNNAGGTIRGAGTGATIQTGDGGDTVTNRGAIISDVGNAIDLEAGNDSLIIEGGAASITGNISGGAGTNTFTLNPGVGNNFSYSGTISNFNTVTVQSGTVTLSGANTFTGAAVVSNGTLNIDSAGSTTSRLAGTTSIAVNTGGTLLLSNSSVTASTDRINDTAPVSITDGKISVQGLSGQSEMLGSLSLTGSSTLDFGTGTGNTLKFAGLASFSGTLQIWNWTGSAYLLGQTDPGTNTSQDRLIFDVSPGLSGSQLGQISFFSGAGTGFLGTGAQIGFGASDFEIVPVPEPSSMLVASALLGLACYRERRRLGFGLRA